MNHLHLMDALDEMRLCCNTVVAKIMNDGLAIGILHIVMFRQIFTSLKKDSYLEQQYRSQDVNINSTLVLSNLGTFVLRLFILKKYRGLDLAGSQALVTRMLKM